MPTRTFYKMSGSGNDFVIFDARKEPAGALDDPVVIAALCARGTGVGADGVVFIEPATDRSADFRMRYFNRDGSRGEMCGNASLCVTRLARDLGAAGRPAGREMHFETDSGMVSARVVGALSEVDVAPVTEVRADAGGIDRAAGEQRIGFARVGVPHLVVLSDDIAPVDVVARGRALRTHRTMMPAGANVNFVSPDPATPGRWLIRTYERGVEAETLACGTGAVASAILLSEWGRSASETTFRTRSDREVTVQLTRDGSRWLPRLRGEGRLVFTGQLADA